MKKILKKSLLIPLLLLSLLAVSCEDDWRIEERLVGEWVYNYEDREIIEEERFCFTREGLWTSTYYYDDIWGPSVTRVDGGYFEVELGRLKLYSSYYDDIRVFDVEFRGNRLYLWNGDVEMEYIRYR